MSAVNATLQPDVDVTGENKWFDVRQRSNMSANSTTYAPQTIYRTTRMAVVVTAKVQWNDTTYDTRNKQKIKCETENKMRSVIGPV